MDKFVIRRETNGSLYKSIKIRTTAYNILLGIRQVTGQNLSDILEEMVTFCAERLEVRDDDPKGKQLLRG